MFSDTHFHLPLIAEIINDFNTSDFLITLCKNNCFFAQDIGTGCDDLSIRINFIQKAISSLSSDEVNKINNFFFLSAGIWPSVESINNRSREMVILEDKINEYFINENYKSKQNIFIPHLCAIGECGLDHHWNPSGIDGRSENDFNKNVYDGERELFFKQVKLAQKLNLPVIVHSRDAAEETISVLDDAGYHNGEIHCFSYQKDIAKKFLDRGWYIAFGGAVTYTKKNKLDSMKELINYIPEDRLLLETDAPYLAPVPFRGQPNTPLLINNTYDYIAKMRNCSTEKLCEVVDQNIKTLFLSQIY